MDVEQRVALAVVARSPIERLVAFKKKRGWRSLKLYSDVPGEFSRDYHAVTPIIVFTRRDGRIHHFWSGEMSSETTDPGQEFRIPGVSDTDRSRVLRASYRKSSRSA